MAVVVQALVPAWPRRSPSPATRSPAGRTRSSSTRRPVSARRWSRASSRPTRSSSTRRTRAVVEFTPGDQPGGRALADDALRRLVALCLDVERAFGAPVDIEAAFAADGWYLLQARPITTR